jgi:long-chain acyl-CoA synthetase
VLEAAAVGVPDSYRGETVWAFVSLALGATATPDELSAHCREHLAAYKVPRAIQFTTQVPMTSSGKIMRRLLGEIDDGTRSLVSEPDLVGP